MNSIGSTRTWMCRETLAEGLLEDVEAAISDFPPPS
jgi:hypothetical protein